MSCSILIRTIPLLTVPGFRFRNPKNSFPLLKTHRKSVFSWNWNSISPNPNAISNEETVLATGFQQESLINDVSSTIAGNSGFEATLNNLSKWLVAGLFGAMLLWRHDAESLWAAMGSVINSALSTILKKMLNQKRPFSTLRSDPGMPSSHAQSIFYTATFYVVYVVQCFGLNGCTAVLSGIIFAVGSYFSWLRISQKLHTICQVLVGGGLGLCFSALWFWLWDAIVFKAFVSSLLVRIVVVLGAAGFCVGFLVYVIRYWVIDEQ